jgi:hypothetical protein
LLRDFAPRTRAATSGDNDGGDLHILLCRFHNFFIDNASDRRNHSCI